MSKKRSSKTETTLLKNTNTLTKEGYIIKKTADNINLILSLKKELTVEPHMTFKQANMKPQKFPVYQETDDYLVVPTF